MNPPQSSIPPDSDPARSEVSQPEVDVYAETFRTSAAQQQTAADGIPKRIGRFDIQKRLGVGAFGEVFLGYDSALDRKVAIKAPKGDYSEENIQNFLTEAKSLAQLQHPGIVSVYDVGREGNRCYIVTEYLPGTLLSHYLTDERLEWLRCVKIVAHLAAALGHAHSRGIMHRDIKPSNIMMMPEGRCVLLDFGLAVNDLQSSRGEVAGTPSYMSPEQVRGESHRVDGRTDIYSLGVVLYELLTGRCPFRSSEMLELFRRIREDAPQPVRQLNPDVPASIEKVCLRALEKDLTKRYTTAGDFAEALLDAVGIQSNPLKIEPPPLPSAPVAEDSVVHTATVSVKHESIDSSRFRRLREAELRLVTLLGISFDVSQRQLDAESQHTLAENFSLLVESLSAQFGGFISVASGHEFEICFGFPVAYEDAVSRAVHCGMEVFNRADTDPELPNRDEIYAVVHTGQAVVEESSLGVKVTGDVSLALRRLMNAIDAESVMVTDRVSKSSRMYFEQERIGEVSVRGLADSILLYKVVKEASVTLNRVELVDPGNLTPLVGRDTELSILKDRWEQATEEMGQIVLLIGEAGLGKSRLIREIREHVSAEGDEPDIIELRCSQHHQSAGLYPMVEHLTKLLKFEEHSTSESRVVAIERYLDGLRLRSDRNVSLLAGLLNVEAGQLPALEVSPQRKRELTAAFLLELLKQRAEFRPVLFIVEDLHWVDPTLLELLAAYVEEFDQSRILSIFTFRPEFETPWRSKQHQTQIALNRLSRKQIRDMMHKRFGRTDLPDVVVEKIVERTDGIPLFIEEFSNILAESGSLEGDSISEDLLNQIIPASLQDLLMARLDRMSSNPEVIQLASAIGREFSFPLLRAASDLPEDLLQDELSKLAEAQVLFQKGKYPDASFIFKHALIQDSAYNSLLKKRRQDIHSRIGTALEASFPDTTDHQPELLAHHFTKADETEKAVDYWLKAGQRSQALFANLEAIGHYRNGLKVIETLEESGERDQMENNFQLSLVTVLVGAYGYAAQDVDPTLRRARALSERIGNSTQLFHVLWFVWAMSLIRSQLDQAVLDADWMLKIAEEAEDDGLIMEACFGQACTDFFRGDFLKVPEFGERGLSLYDEERCRMHAMFIGQNAGVTIRNFFSCSLWFLGAVDRAKKIALEAVALAREIEHAFSQVHGMTEAAWVHYYSRDKEKTFELAEEALSISQKHGFPFWEACAMNMVGGGLILQEEYEQGILQVRKAMDLIYATGGSLHQSFMYSVLVEGLRGAGHYEQALAEIEKALAIGTETHELYMRAELLRQKGQVLLEQSPQNTQTAESCFIESLSFAESQSALSQQLRTQIHLSKLWNTQGKKREALQQLTEIYGQFSEGFETLDLRDATYLIEELAPST